MAFLVLKGERSLAAVVTRAYGDLPAADRRRVEEALRRANPQLSNVREMGRGALIVIPAVPGVGPKADTASEAMTTAPEAMAEVRNELASGLEQIEARVRAERTNATALTALLKSRQMKTLVRRVPRVSSHVERVTAAAKARVEQLDGCTASLQSLAKADSALHDLLKRIR